MPPKGQKKDPNAAKNRAATRIQQVIRKFLARVRMRKVSYATWMRVYDPAFRLYFFYNRVNGKSQWTLPMFMQWFTKADDAAGNLIGRAARTFVGKMRARKMAHESYTRFFDANVNKFYWINKATNLTFWKASRWLLRQEIPMPAEDLMLYNQYIKITELTRQLKEKDHEIKQIRQARYEELEPAVLESRVKDAKLLVRSKNMDEWSIDELAAWFTEMKMDTIVPFVYKNRVDGNLFINLSEDDWEDMGIKNRFHVRKLQIIMRAFYTRFERKKDKGGDKDDELMSEYAPSELSDIVNAQDEEGDFDDEEEEDFDQDNYVQEVVRVGLSEEQMQERVLDEINIQIQNVVPGDGVSFPVTGDIVRLKYTCYLLPSMTLVTSTKNGMGKVSVEFVLGIGQVIKGFDRAVTRMSIGERSKVSMTPDYAYGKDGLFPYIPADSEVMFEMTLLAYKPRPFWYKPLLQEPGLSEKPYLPEKGALIKVGGVGIPADDASVASFVSKK